MARMAMILVAVICAPILTAQQPVPRFEVASVKPSPPESGQGVLAGGVLAGVPLRPGQWIARNATLLKILRQVYWDFRFPGQIVGAPDWTDRERWHIEARYPVGLSYEEVRRMAEALLGERFRLRTHVDKRVLPAFGLELVRRDGRLGPRLRSAAGECVGWLAATGQTATPPRRECVGSLLTNGQLRTYHARDADLSSLIDILADTLERPVVDRTDLKGRFDIDLEWVVPTSGASPEPDGVTIMTALQEQLRLKVASVQAPVSVLVIDHIERPTPD